MCANNHNWDECRHKEVDSVGSNTLCPLISPYKKLVHLCCVACGLVSWTGVQYEKAAVVLPGATLSQQDRR